ncbi:MULTISPECIES: DUF4105 domain-containing protein [Moraxella]|uniref:Lnb N-terminal periplasmic domain-containing protein n=1 Tax=Moraxella TaxID=475 RepID=UPI00187EAAAE|nr:MULTISPECIES: DUF4105 domain-containing protein [Moraxella]MBE9579146.1 DUF4105 domain-containing protein [Moraxella sp. K1664]MBE9588440.1 DUF4105 domain-containing protein [Moraxella sp. K1630]MBE9596600.1 DUF4105 domain-containing protein [Moraxella sp. K2450]MDH9219152.1 DUF4105 domain-containing protein [Moraxella lacunata]
MTKLFMLYAMMIILLAIWTCLALWVHMPLGRVTYVVIGFILLLSIIAVIPNTYIEKFEGPLIIDKLSYYSIRIFGLVVGVVFAWFFSMKPSNDRIWQDEFRHQFTYTQNGNIITIHNVRDFDWHGDSYTERWDTRTYNLNHLTSLDMISTTWGMDSIAHIMVSFGFDDGAGNIDRLVFSVETRKEIGEEFSTIGGFFRMYDLSIIAGDERDLIYTRTNIRDELVSVYPILYDKDKMRNLFLTYLDYGHRLNDMPKFYHSLLSNCTTVIYKMASQIDDVPMDYRIIVSGRLADYLYDKGAIDNEQDLMIWKYNAFANPKVSHLGNHGNISSQEYSALIREGLSY